MERLTESVGDCCYIKQRDFVIMVYCILIALGSVDGGCYLQQCNFIILSSPKGSVDDFCTVFANIGLYNVVYVGTGSVNNCCYLQQWNFFNRVKSKRKRGRVMLFATVGFYNRGKTNRKC